MTDFSDPRTVWARRDQLQIVDVRETFEFAAGAITGDMNVTLDDLMLGGGPDASPDPLPSAR